MKDAATGGRNLEVHRYETRSWGAALLPSPSLTAEGLCEQAARSETGGAPIAQRSLELVTVIGTDRRE